MPKLEKIVKKRSAPPKILHMSLPDEDTMSFWRMTADDPREHVARIARFSRIVGGKVMTNAVQRSGRRLRDVATVALPRRPPGNLLVLPMHSDLTSPSFRQGSHPRRADASREGSSGRAPIVCNDRETQKATQGGNMKAPGIRAKKAGTKMRRGAATQVMIYPRPKTKAVLVQASRDVNRPLSSFVLLASLKEAAELQGCDIADLVPAAELEQYRKSRIDRR